MSNSEDFFEKLLRKYGNTFDIVKDYKLGKVQAAAYGFYKTVSEKYVLNPKANLWSIHGYEHILFFIKDTVSEKDITDSYDLVKNHMVPKLVCKGKKYPEKDHMYSYLTIAFICEHAPDENTLSALRKFKYEKNFLFTLRGYAQAHMVLMDTGSGKAYANRAGKHLAGYYEKIFNGDKP